MDQSNLLENMVEFNNKTRSKSKEDKEKKEITRVHFMKVEN